MDYVVVKHLHMTLALISLLGFVLRWQARLLQWQWVDKKWVRIAPHVIDTGLLLSAFYLLFLLNWYPLGQGWLWAKVAFLILYIGFGVLAIRPNTSRSLRVKAGFLAVACFGAILFSALNRAAFGG